MNPTIDEEHTCSYCNKSFRRESTLVAHMCEPKRRHTERNERSVQLGYHAYREFYETSQGSAKFKTHDEFIKSPYYRAFVKFGRYAIGVKASMVNNASILFSDFNIGYNTNPHAFSECSERSISYGIDMLESIHFAIEENNFTTTQTAGEYIGVRRINQIQGC